MNLIIKNINKNKGMTFIEIALAIAIFGYIILGFSQLFIKNTLAMNQSKTYNLAYNWAADKMEDIRTTYYSAVTTGTWTAETSKLSGGINYTRIVNVSEIESGLKEIEVKVIWTDLSGSREARVVSTKADY